MEIQTSQSIRARDGVLLRELDGEAVILNLNTEMYLGLNDVGCRMWTVFTEAPSIDAGLEQLQGEYDVAADILRQDALTLIHSLIEQELVDLKP